MTRDSHLLWHPYAPLNSHPLYAVTHARESTLVVEDRHGKTFRVIDTMSSWWSQVHGYRNPVLDEALASQASKFSHVMFGGLTHEPAVELAEKLVSLTPDGLNHVFLADSGSVAVEVSLKLAVQFQTAVGKPHRRGFLALRGGYHGDTIGAMGVSDPENSMHRDFAQLVQSQHFLPRPPRASYDLETQRWIVDAHEQETWKKQATAVVEQWSEHVAAIIVEPIAQGAGGMHFYHPACLNHLRALANECGFLLIFDEIATGFGRTGKLFAAQWAGVIPDVLLVGKALTGGYLTQGAVVVSSGVADIISSSKHKALMHGPTFMGNPLASAVSARSLDLVSGTISSTSQWCDNVPRISTALTRGLAPARSLRSVADVRVLGAIGVIELHEPVDIPALTAEALKQGVWVRPFKNLVYTMPTYICTDAELELMCSGLVAALEKVHG